MVAGTQVNNDCSTSVCWVSRFPREWLNISAFGNIVITCDGLQRLDAEQRSCLRDYLLGGGLVSVIGCQDREPSLVKDALGVRLSDADSTKRFRFSGSWPSEAAIFNAGMGRLLISKEDTLSLTRDVYHSLDNIAEGRQTFSSLRGTNEEMVAGVNYWNWLIPNVGKPPIWSFVAFIGLFAGIAGPGLLYFTMRARRPSCYSSFFHHWHSSSPAYWLAMPCCTMDLVRSPEFVRLPTSTSLPKEASCGDVRRPSAVLHRDKGSSSRELRTITHELDRGILRLPTECVDETTLVRRFASLSWPAQDPRATASAISHANERGESIQIEEGETPRSKIDPPATGTYWFYAERKTSCGWLAM